MADYLPRDYLAATVKRAPCTIELSADLDDALRRLAAESGLSIAALVALGLALWLAKEGTAP